jgi:hypothetical protein
VSDNRIITITLFVAGVVPFALAGGLSDDASIWPWSAGLLCQAGVVIGFIAQSRGWWRRVSSSPRAQ